MKTNSTHTTTIIKTGHTHPNRRFTAFVAGREIRLMRHDGTHARTFSTAGHLGKWLAKYEYFLTNAPGTFRGVPEYCYVQYWGDRACTECGKRFSPGYGEFSRCQSCIASSCEEAEKAQA